MLSAAILPPIITPATKCGNEFAQVLNPSWRSLKAQNIDITNFEAQLDDTFKTAFAKTTTSPQAIQTTIDEIDKSIDHLQKTKCSWHRQKSSTHRNDKGAGRDDQRS